MYLTTSSLINQLVRISPTSNCITNFFDDKPVARVVKFSRLENEVLLVNPECTSLYDILNHQDYKWACWVPLKEITMGPYHESGAV